VDSGSSRSLTDPRFRSALALMVKKRVPESDVEDIVQSALAEAVASPSAPKDDPEALRRWIWGVARHKVVDFHRRARREEMGGDVPEVPVEGAPHSDRDLLRWAAEELPPGQDAERTLEWMLREGEGEKLESIAESEALPAPRVRQRVTRLRRHLRTRWAAEIAALAALGVLVILAIWLVRREKPRPDIVRPETPVPMQSSELRPVPPPVLPADGDHSFDQPNNVTPLTPTPTSPIPSSSASPMPTPRPTGTPTAITPAPPSTTPVTKVEAPTGKKAPGPSKPTAPKSKPAGTSDLDSFGGGSGTK
jgi:RNA polymerase sigma factor (sigma-70 family)